MLDRGLTKERALEEVGAVVSRKEIVVTRENYGAVKEEFDREFDRASADGEVAFGRMGRAGSGIEWHADILPERQTYLMDLRERHNTARAILDIFIFQSVADFSIEAQQLSVEAILNAVEHGSDYCREGDVLVRFVIGETRFLLEVLQDREFDAHETYERAQRGQDHKRREGFFRYEPGGKDALMPLTIDSTRYVTDSYMIRGNGLTNLVESEDVVINTDREETSGRVRLLMVMDID